MRVPRRAPSLSFSYCSHLLYYSSYSSSQLLLCLRCCYSQCIKKYYDDDGSSNDDDDQLLEKYTLLLHSWSEFCLCWWILHYARSRTNTHVTVLWVFIAVFLLLSAFIHRYCSSNSISKIRDAWMYSCVETSTAPGENRTNYSNKLRLSNTTSSTHCLLDVTAASLSTQTTRTPPHCVLCFSVVLCSPGRIFAFLCVSLLWFLCFCLRSTFSFSLRALSLFHFWGPPLLLL